MKFVQRLAATIALTSLFVPGVAFADENIRSCCVLVGQSGVSSCFQFLDTAVGSPPTPDSMTAIRQQQRYKCADIPFVYDDRRGNIATYYVNDEENSGICGTALSAACEAPSGATISRSTVFTRCLTAANCGTSSNYICEDGFCKVPEGKICSGEDNTTVNCANGLLCRTTPEGKKCLTAEADISAPAASVGTTVGEGDTPFSPVVPVLGVPIPGFEFTPATEVDGVVSVPYLAQYINAIYRYMTAIVLTVAIVMIVVGGFKYLLAATPLAVKDGKKTITDALIGMLLVLGAYVILNTVNPSLLSLKTLQLERVVSQEIEFSLAYGGMADDGEAAPETGPLVSAEAAAPGTWRANALAVCGDSNVAGMSLDAKKARLKTIVTTWTNLASTQKGSIYVRGGTLACAGSGTEFSYKAGTLKRIKSSGYAVNVTEDCLNNPPGNRESNPCTESLSAEYRRLVSAPGGANGLICGDCGSYQRSLLRCFGGNAYAQPVLDAQFAGREGVCDSYTPHPDDIGFLKLTNMRALRYRAAYDETEVANLINRLQFGDMLMWSSNDRTRHVFMYTGKAGLPYEIVEMGGGGQGDVIGGADGKAFWAKIGLGNFDGSHVKAHRSAVDYIKSTPHSGAKCLKAVRVIDN